MLELSCVLGWQQIGAPDSWTSYDFTGTLWKIQRRLYNHSRPGHWWNVPCHVWHDSGRGNLKPAGSKLLLNECILHVHNVPVKRFGKLSVLSLF